MMERTEGARRIGPAIVQRRLRLCMGGNDQTRDGTRDGNGGDPRSKLAALAAARNPIYALAPIHIRSRPLPHDAAVDAILKALGR